MSKNLLDRGLNFGVGDFGCFCHEMDYQDGPFRDIPENALCRVVGYSMTISPRYPAIGKKPGRYLNPKGVYIAVLETGRLYFCNVSYLKPEGKLTGTLFENTWICGLPETEFFEMDIVRLRPQMAVEPDTVHSIGYIDYKEERHVIDSNTAEYMINIGCDGQGTYKSVCKYDLELVSRGPVWHHHKNLPFDWKGALKAEAHFQMNMRLYEEIRNPRHELFDWASESEAVGFARDKPGFAVRISPNISGWGKRISVYKFEDVALGEHLKEAGPSSF